MINLTTYFKSYETKTAQKTSLNIYCSNDISKKIIEDMIILRFLLIRVDCGDLLPAFSKDFFAIILIRHFHKFAIIRNSRERESMRNNSYHEQGVGTVCAIHIVLWFCHKQLFSLRNISFTFLFHLNSTIGPSVHGSRVFQQVRFEQRCVQ